MKITLVHLVLCLLVLASLGCSSASEGEAKLTDNDKKARDMMLGKGAGQNAP